MLSQILNIIVVFFSVRVLTKEDTQAMKQKLYDFSDYISFDLETTGRNSKTCEIIEISGILVRNNEVKEEFSSLVNPGIRISSEIENLTGITNDMLSAAPSLDNVLPEFIAFIDDKPLIGYNIASFDLHILNRFTAKLLGRFIDNYYIDLLTLSRKMLPELSSHKLGALASFCHCSAVSAHRALSDSLMVHECFQYMKEHLPDTIVTTKQFQYTDDRSNARTSLQKKENQALRILHESVPSVIADDALTESCHDKVDAVAGMAFCLTGDFSHGSKSEIKEIIESHGGRCVGSVSGKTDYVIVGTYGSEQWACGNYGSKIKKAMELQAKGSDIRICSEKDLFDMLNLLEKEAISNTFAAVTSFEAELNQMLLSIIQEKELPLNSLHLYANLSTTSKEEMSKSICIFEPEYPPVKDDCVNPGKNFVVMNIQMNDTIELLIRNLQFENIPLPHTGKRKAVPSDKTFRHIIFDYSDRSIFGYIKENVLYCLKNYHSRVRSFGCCSKFMECSNAKKCIHVNKLYATACAYKYNLENGRIFYGGNKNI